MITLEKEKKFNIGLLLFRLVSLIIILICLLFLYNWNSENNENEELASNLADNFIISIVPDVKKNIENTESNKSNEDTTSIDNANIETFKVDFEKLFNENEDTVGWIKINNTNINFPIVQTNNNSFYLKHNFKKQYNSAGWIFADYRNNFNQLDKNTIIYGHNRRNNTMFSSLKSFLNTYWFDTESNNYFTFITKDNNYIAKIFSIYKINENNLNLYNSFENENQFYETINDYKQKSIYNFNLDVSYEDNIITLCTCDNNNKYRIVVHAKLVNAN